MADYAAHFNGLYAAKDDPWNYKNSPYEARKYDATCAALMRPRYRSALEVGCSIGVLSARIAARCDMLVSLDLSSAAVAAASMRLAAFPQANARQATLPGDWPRGRYDLIMLSEIIYYLTAPEICEMADLVARDALPRAECVLVHWQGDTQTAIRANEARDIFCGRLAALRPTETIDHPSPADYDHRTLLLSAV